MLVRSHRYRWKYWGFPDEITENPCLIKETPHYFKTEYACLIDAKAYYKTLNTSFPIVLSIINEPRACFPDYNTVENRMKSFTNWPPSMPFKPSVMAEAGFFYTGMYDKVICFACGKGLCKWEPSDNPREEHEKYSPNCYYLKTRATSLQSTSDPELGVQLIC